MGFRDFFRRRFDVRREHRLEFLHEQDGEQERRVKNALEPLLIDTRTIARAYLARVGFEPGAAPSVALCLVSDIGDDTALVRRVSEVFRPLAPPNVFLDVVFLTAAQEEDLRRVCPPFHSRAT